MGMYYEWELCQQTHQGLLSVAGFQKPIEPKQNLTWRPDRPGGRKEEEVASLIHLGARPAHTTLCAASRQVQFVFCILPFCSHSLPT